MIATTRREDRAELLRSLGADEVVIDNGQIAAEVRGWCPAASTGFSTWSATACCATR